MHEKTAEPSWKQIVDRFRTPSRLASSWQLANSLLPYLGLWAAMVWSLGVSYWLTLALAVPAAGFLVRIFIIFHDCGHGSFFRSRRANHVWGVVTGLLTFTPYQQWRHDHAVHHATSGDLDRRGRGDIWTLTVREYLEASRWKRFAYRIVRNPVVLFVVAPMYLFLIENRFPTRGARRRERLSVMWTNVALLGVVLAMGLTIGVNTFLLVQLPISLVATVAGVWLFYVQHQFEGVYWERGSHWEFDVAALQGSSYYKLPRVLQWFTGNIGYHHIHHLSPGIPNYNLEKVHRREPRFQRVTTIGLWGSLKSLSYRLWDERSKRLVGFGALRRVRRATMR